MFKYALLLLVAGLIVFGVGVQGQMMQEKESSPMSHQCMAMMNMRQNMTAEMDTMDTKLEKMVATLKSAKGEDRWAAVTAILDELVSQRKAMREKMSQMQGGMMGHMADHMAKGMTGDAQKSMMDCPMMKGMQDIKTEEMQEE